MPDPISPGEVLSICDGGPLLLSVPARAKQSNSRVERYSHLWILYLILIIRHHALAPSLISRDSYFEGHPRYKSGVGRLSPEQSAAK